MKKYKVLSFLLLAFIFVFICPLNVFANSSWRWISETRPYDVLPFVVILTLVIECLSVCFIAKVKNIPKLIFVVLLANILSFAAPYLFLFIIPSLYTFEQTLEHTPFYIVGITYLFITLAVEIPTVYFTLKKSSPNPQKLLFTIIGVNVLTTILTAIIERIFCTGSW